MSYDHVIHQEGDIQFYVPCLFIHAIYQGMTVPLLVSDVLQLVEKSKYVCLNYYQAQIWILFWGNHPLEKISVLGCVVGCRSKFIGDEDYLLFRLDDCSGGFHFLNCKCSKELALSCGMSWGSLSGRRLKVFGVFKLQWCELDVEYFEFCDNLQLEIDHWTEAIKYRAQLMLPWSFEDPSASGKNQTDSDAHDYVQQLHKAALMDEILIATPSNSLALDDAYDRIRGRDPQQDLGTSGAREGSVIVSCSLTEAKSNLLRVLISRDNHRTSTTELYQDLSDLLDQVAALKFQQQNLVSHVKPWEQLRTEVFNDMLGKLEQAGLLYFPNIHVLDWISLKNLHNYSVERTWTLLKLQCNVGVLDHDYIRRKLSKPELTGKAILDVFKETLRAICEAYPNFLASWWIDTDRNSSVIHFVYP